MMTESNDYVRHRSPYATVSEGLFKLMVEKKVGSNGWPVMMALHCGVHANRVLDRRSAAQICEMTGLTRAQVARGMAELRNKGIIAPVIRRDLAGYAHLDRSNQGHVAQYCFTKSAWESVSQSLVNDDAESAEDA